MNMNSHRRAHSMDANNQSIGSQSSSRGGGGTGTTGGGGAEANQMDANQSLGSCSRDDLDALLLTNDSQRTRLAIEHLQSKIVRTKEAIKSEQTLRDENVNEYLKLFTNADKVQQARIKSVFEKKNQKSAISIANLQRKLDHYKKKISELEMHGYSALHQGRPKEMLRDMGQNLKGVGTNIKEGITGLSSGVIGGIRTGLTAATHTAGE